MGVTLDPQMTWLTFKPVNETAAQEVAKGNWGSNPTVTFEKGNVVLTTTNGTFTFSGPTLPEPNADAGKSITGATAKMEGYDTSMFVDVFQIMLLMHKIANEQKGAAREARTAQQELQYDLLMKAAEDIKQAAGFALAAGIVSGAMQIAGGMFQIGGAVKALGVQKQGMTDLKTMQKNNAPETDSVKIQQNQFAEQTHMGNVGNKVQAWNNASMGGGQMMGGIGEFVSAGLNYAAKMEEAEQKVHEADAQKAGHYAESETEFLNSLRDMIRDVQEKLQAIQQATDDTTKQILRA